VLQSFGLFFEFIVLGISLAAPVGPVKLEMIRQGTAHGFKKAFLTGSGAMTMDLIYMTLIFWGLSPFVSSSLFQDSVAAVGSLLLVHLAWNSLKHAFAHTSLSHSEGKPFLNSPFLTGISLAVANPFILVFWFSVYGTALQKLPDQWSTASQYLFSLAILIGIFLWNVNLSFALHFFKPYIKGRALQLTSFFSGCLLLYYSFIFLISILE
jgi:threonine/homoserine/homoserine lactone efflux protein